MGINAVTHTLSIGPPSAATLNGSQRSQYDSPSAIAEAAPVSKRVIFNPRSHYDPNAGVFVMEFRDTTSGEVERQVPDERQLRAYADAKRLLKKAEPAFEHRAFAPDTAQPSVSVANTAPTGGQGASPEAEQAATGPRVSVDV
ncbi:MAG TPA: hypothetical protein VD978_12990 [Azospirillum sp.]|nr:hypothetical protein [Azospirillum sp.]